MQRFYDYFFTYLLQSLIYQLFIKRNCIVTEKDLRDCYENRQHFLEIKQTSGRTSSELERESSFVKLSEVMKTNLSFENFISSTMEISSVVLKDNPDGKEMVKK